MTEQQAITEVEDLTQAIRDGVDYGAVNVRNTAVQLREFYGVDDAITDEEIEPDEKLMRSIEEQIGVSETAKRTFREEILIRISSLARKGQHFDYTSHERLREAIEKKLFADLRDVVKITTSSKTPDPEQLKRMNEVVNRLVEYHGYTPESANELLRYVGTLLNR